MSDGFEAEPMTIIEQITLLNPESAEILNAMTQGSKVHEYELREHINDPIYNGWATCLSLFLTYYFATHCDYFRVIVFLRPIVESEKSQLA